MDKGPLYYLTIIALIASVVYIWNQDKEITDLKQQNYQQDKYINHLSRKLDIANNQIEADLKYIQSH